MSFLSATGGDDEIIVNGSQTLVSGDTIDIGYTEDVGYFDVSGSVTAEIEAYGGQGGRGRWSGNNDPGAPGGYVKGTFDLKEGRYYFFVGEGNKSVNSYAGSGGGSTDVRTNYPGGTNFSINDFMDNTSLNSRIITAGGGGGCHGGNYGFWGNSNSPGAGGPNKTNTNSRGSNDSGYVDTGADSNQPGQDGGGSQDDDYTGDGEFGRGGIQPNYPNLGYNDDGNRAGWGWPNGGSGTTYANGGGGGGWYGGATNWPNAGGGSNFIQSNGPATLITTNNNDGEIQFGNGLLRITVQ